MEVLAHFIFLMCGAFSMGEMWQARMNYPENDPMLNEMASEFVLDIIEELVSFAKVRDETEGLPEVDGFHSRIRVAGINFEVEAERGSFLGFPSLQTTGETTVTHYFYKDVRYLSLQTPITFGDTFVIFYNNVTLKAEDQRWYGRILMTVKRNEFSPIFTIQHSEPGGRCDVSMGQVKTFSYTDADVVLRVNGIPDINLNNISNSLEGESEYAHDYADLLIRRIFDHYLSTPPKTSYLEHPLMYCTYHTGLASIEEMMGIRKKYDEDNVHTKPYFLRSFIPEKLRSKKPKGKIEH